MTWKGVSLCVVVMCSHINEYHENAILSTLDESLAMFESSASQRIWDMMDKEFETAKSSILENERTKTSIRLSPPLSSSIPSFIPYFKDNLPLNTRKLVTPPILSSKSDSFHRLKVKTRTTTSPKPFYSRAPCPPFSRPSAPTKRQTWREFSSTPSAIPNKTFFSLLFPIISS